jgi:hypothetical protein
MSVVKNNISMERQNKYVVIRNGLRVSDLEYSNKEEAKMEYDHWKNIIARWPDGSKLEILETKGR